MSVIDLLQALQRDHSTWRRYIDEPEAVSREFGVSADEAVVLANPTVGLRRAVEAAGVRFGIFDEPEPPEPPEPEPEPEPEPSPPEPEPEPEPSPPEPEPEPEPSPPEPEPEPEPSPPEPEPEPEPSPPQPDPPPSPPPDPAPEPEPFPFPFDPHWPPSPPHDPAPPVIPELKLPPVNDYKIGIPKIWPIGKVKVELIPRGEVRDEQAIREAVVQVNNASRVERLAAVRSLMEELQ